MVALSPRMENLYSIIAGRLIWEPDFLTRLLKNTRKALEDTLDETGVLYDKENLDELMAKFEEVKDSSKMGEIVFLANRFVAADRDPEIPATEPAAEGIKVLTFAIRLSEVDMI